MRREIDSCSCGGPELESEKGSRERRKDVRWGEREGRKEAALPPREREKPGQRKCVYTHNDISGPPLSLAPYSARQSDHWKTDT